jgi:hypothetical protein
MVVLLRLLVVVALNAVPIWGFTQDEWSAGTTLALYWIQGAVGIPVTAVLILMHRRMTRKRGHYKGGQTYATVNGKPVVVATFLGGFLWMAIPFVVAHGIFLGFLLGLVWKDAEGALQLADLRLGASLLLNVMAIGFAVDVFKLAERPFGWIRQRSEALMQRTMIIHMVILIGMGAAAFAKKDATAFFNVFLVLKFLTDIGSELPQWDPREAPAPLRWIAQRAEQAEPGGEDFDAYWKRIRKEQKDGFEDDELEMPASRR